jgi:hypothetical protein
MVLSKNITFIAVLGALAVVFIAVLVWAVGWVAARREVGAQREDKLAELERLRKDKPTEEHLAAVSEEHEKAETEYAKLKELLLTWWDRSVYDETESPRQPTLFLGNLQRLRSHIRAFAEEKGVVLGGAVENLGFLELANDAPPVEVTLDMLKQRSIMRDIILLLIHNGVESIDSVQWLGPAGSGKLYSKYRVSVSFTCEYPALARFLQNLIDVDKEVIPGYGRLPKNYLVVESPPFSYSATDRKVAALDTSTSTTRTATGTTRSLRGPGDTYGQPPGGRSSATGTDTARRTTAREEGPNVGREPNYNILTVTLTISMVDFGKEITGDIEDLRKPSEESEPTGRRTTRSAPNAAR